MPPDAAPAPIHPPGPLRGRVDRIASRRVAGWAHDPTRPDAPVELELVDNGAAVARFFATHHRDDLQAAGIGRGCCAFDLAVPAGWSALGAHVLQVRRACDGTELPGSPVTMQPEATFAPRLTGDLAGSLRVLAARHGEDDVQSALRCLARQTDRLLRARAMVEGAPPLADLDAFYARWGGWLDDPRPPVPRRPPQRPIAIRRRALLVADALADALIPSVAAILRGLERLGHEICIVAAERCTSDEPRAALAAAGRICFAPPLVPSVEDATRMLAGLCDVALLYGAPQALCYAALLRRHLPRARLLLCLDTLASGDRAHRFTTEQRPDLQAVAAQAQTREAVAAWSVDAVLTRSETDARRLCGMVTGLAAFTPDFSRDEALDRTLRSVLRLPPMMNDAGRHNH